MLSRQAEIYSVSDGVSYPMVPASVMDFLSQRLRAAQTLCSCRHIDRAFSTGW